MYYMGLDVSMKETSVCVVDQEGEIFRETVVPTDINAFIGFISALGPDVELESIGLETGSLSRHHCTELRKFHDNVICLDARQVSVFLKTKSHKNDRNDARVIAELLRMKHLESVHVKSDNSVQIKTILKSRRMFVNDLKDKKNTVRGLLKHLGIHLKAGSTTAASFIEKVNVLIDGIDPLEKTAIEVILVAIEECEKHIKQMDKLVDSLLKKHSEIVSLLTTVDGIGPITSLAFIGEIDDPKRFKNGRSVGAYVGCVPTLYESGEISVKGRISKMGPIYLRSLLSEAALVMLTRTKRFSYLKRWGLRLVRDKGTKKATIAVARKLSIILWRIWMTKEPFQFSLKEKLEKEAKELKVS